MPRRVAWVALGGNLGQVADTFRVALRDMATWPGTQLLGVSALYETQPWEAQGPLFLNAVSAWSTALGPQEWLSAMLALENRLGRERPHLHAPRSLDLDLLAFDDHRSATPFLQLPHPRALERAFVLAPWAELRNRVGSFGQPPLPDAAELARLCEAQGATLSRAPGWEKTVD
ncbi:MAG: 2-amino-4-hydroxy-6-hydroxymethyldihydropteridine diphosphokinase [Pseudomonadota bacterium]